MYPHYHDRHRVPSGITGWAQVNGLRGDTSIDDRARFDNFYIEHWSVGRDLKIIILTFRTFMKRYRGTTEGMERVVAKVQIQTLHKPARTEESTDTNLSQAS